MNDVVPSADDSSALCLSCGLCCDGTLFFRAPVAPTDDLSILRKLEARGVAFRLDAKGGFFELPCACLEGKKCGVYPDRPAVCGDYKCQLLRRLQAGEASLEQVQERVREAFSLLDAVRAEVLRVDPALATRPPLSLPRGIEALAAQSEEATPGAGAGVRRRYARLLLHLLVLHRHLEQHFDSLLASPDGWTPP